MVNIDYRSIRKKLKKTNFLKLPKLFKLFKPAANFSESFFE